MSAETTPPVACGERVQVPGQSGVYTRACGKPSVVTRVVGWEHQTVHLCAEHNQPVINDLEGTGDV